MTKVGVFTSLGVILFLSSGFQIVEAHGRSHNPTRHHYIMRYGIPAEYENLLNPLHMTTGNLNAGRMLYNGNCTVCHGPSGQGDGVSAATLDPAPPALTEMYERPMRGMGSAGPNGHLMHGVMHHHPGMTHAEAMGGLNLDAYIFWSISEGGQQMGGSMPAFKDNLSEKERWQILLYMANGFTLDAEQ